ncbi:MAG TPA: hypothetical protein VIN67_11580 [Desulfobaccales bacterium]
MVHEYLIPILPFFITSLVSFFVILDPTGNIFAFWAVEFVLQGLKTAFPLLHQ